eukprot:1687165-Prymnesium_polylepis.1
MEPNNKFTNYGGRTPHAPHGDTTLQWGTCSRVHVLATEVVWALHPCCTDATPVRRAPSNAPSKPGLHQAWHMSTNEVRRRRATGPNAAHNVCDTTRANTEPAQ